jgi:hypothetical protein
MRFKVNDVWDELTYLGYHLHWPLDQLLDLEHRDRRGLLQRVARLNDRAWQELANRV